MENKSKKINMINSLIINPHLAPSIILMVLGGSLCIISFVHLFIRSKAFIWSPIPDEKINTFERKMLNIGLLTFALGVLTFAIIDSFFGHKYLEIDNNKKMITDQILIIIAGAISLIFGIVFIFVKTGEFAKKKDKSGWYILEQNKIVKYFVISFYILLGLTFIVAGLQQL